MGRLKGGPPAPTRTPQPSIPSDPPIFGLHRRADGGKMATMKRLILGLVLAGLVALAVPSSAPAANSYNDLFVGCDETAEPPQPSHECLTTDHMAAYFEATEATKYEICLYLNETLDPLDCTSAEKAEANTLYWNSLQIETPGDYEVVWFDLEVPEEDEEIAVWKLTMSSPPQPLPPPPAPPAAAPIVLPALPSLSTACLNAEKRVKKLKARVKKAHGQQKAKLKAKLKKARAAAKAAC
jgi:hypothetical protein